MTGLIRGRAFRGNNDLKQFGGGSVINFAHDAYVASVRAREGPITGYIVAIEGKLFACSNNATWLREFYSRLPVPPPS